MVQEGTHNLNVTLKGYPKKFWGLFGQKAHKTQQNHTISPQSGGLSLTLMIQGKTSTLNTNPSSYPMKLSGLVGMAVHTAHTTKAKFPDWLILQN